MKLVYLYHSGFALLGEGYTIVFDYFEDSRSADKGILHEEILSREGQLYVLASHSHYDHFNREVLSWSARRPDIVYVFSRAFSFLLEIPTCGRYTGWRKAMCFRMIFWKYEPLVRLISAFRSW